MRKFVRRHRAGVAAALLLLVTLTGGITVSLIQARRAERRFNEVRQLAHAVLYDIDDAIRDLQGAAKAREVVVKTALQYLDGLAAEAAGDRDIQIEIADAYVRVGDVQGGALMLSLGHTEQALESYRKAMQIADDLGHRYPEYAKADYIRMKSREQIGDILARRRADIAGALRLYAEGVEIGETFRHHNPTDAENLRRLSSLYMNIARDGTDSAQSIAAAKNAVPILEQIAVSDKNDEDQQSLCEGYSVLAKTLNYTNQPEEAFRYLEKSLHVREALLAAHPENARYRRQLMIEYSKLGDLMGPFTPTLDKPAAANAYYDKMLAIAEQLSSGDPNNPRAAFDHAMALTKKGAVMPADSDAIAVLQQSLVIFEGLAKSDPKDRRVPVQEGNLYYSVARRYLHSGNSDAAIQNYTSAIRLYEAQLGPESKDLQATRGLHSAYEALAKLYAAKNMKTEALEFAGKAIATAESARAIDPTNPVTQALLPQSYAAQGSVLATFSDTKGACAAYSTSAAGWERIQPQRGWPKDRDAQLDFSRHEAARCAIR
jgi:tetratricopeptide (TPR) repeat protein